MLNLSIILDQAIEDYSSVNLDDQNVVSRIKSGFKIIKEGNSITIYDTHISDYYKEISEEDYAKFFKHGWVKTVRKLTLKRYKKKLIKIEQIHKEEINGRNNAKYLDYLKQVKVGTLNKYYKLTQKLN